MQRKLTKILKRPHSEPIKKETDFFTYESVSSATEFLGQHLLEEHLFSGSVNYRDVELCLEYFKIGFRDYSSFGEPRITAFVLKRFIRENQEKIVPEILYHSIVDAIKYGDEIQLVNSLRNLSKNALAILSAIVRMLRKAKHLSPKALAACWGASIFKLNESFPETGNKLVEALITKENLFSIILEAEATFNPRIAFKEEISKKLHSTRGLKVLGMHRFDSNCDLNT